MCIPFVYIEIPSTVFAKTLKTPLRRKVDSQGGRPQAHSVSVCIP